jgi:hypothetical protein
LRSIGLVEVGNQHDVAIMFVRTLAYSHRRATQNNSLR